MSGNKNSKSTEQILKYVSSFQKLETPLLIGFEIPFVYDYVLLETSK